MKRGAAVIFLAFLIGGCGLFRQQQKEYFTLDTMPPEGTAVSLSGLPIGVDSFQLPPPVARREIVIREDSGEVDPRGRELWAAPLDEMVMHTLAFDLAARVPEGMVILPGQPKPVGAMRSIYVVADRFTAGPDSVLVLDVHWVVKEPAGDTAGEAHRERIAIPIPSLESAEIAQGMSRALAELADRIVAAL